jgi:hypothetical protein
MKLKLKRLSPRRLVLPLAVLVAAGVAIGALASTSQTAVTKPRLERSLPKTFARLYVQQARILGHKGITVASLHARADCDKGGPNVPDRGPGADWICLMTWHDPYLDPTLLPGKFEMNVHSNQCYTAGGPSKIVGLLTITDAHGKDVPNPVFEFDGCFDPHGDNSPTRITIAPKPNTPTTATADLSLPTGTITRTARGAVAPTLVCSNATGGCAGTLTAALDGRPAGTRTYAIAPGRSASVTFDLGTRPTGRTLVLTAHPVIGTAKTASARLAIAAR